MNEVSRPVFGNARWRRAASALALATLAVVAAPLSLSAGDTSEPRRVVVDGGGSYTEIGPKALAAMLAAQRVTLVNVHVPYAGEIEGTTLFVPFDEIAKRADRLPADRDARLVVYCRSGHMSAIAAKTLVRLGYRDVSDLEGGMQAWEGAGYRLARRNR